MRGPAELALVYVEFDPEVPPFMWMHGHVVAEDAQAERADAYRNLANLVDGRARTIRDGGRRATRAVMGGPLLVEFPLDGVGAEGRQLRATTVVIGALNRGDWIARCAPQVADILREGEFAVDQGHVRRALEWGRANTARPFPGLAQAVRRLFRRLGLGRAGTAFEPAGRA